MYWCSRTKVEASVSSLAVVGVTAAMSRIFGACNRSQPFHTRRASQGSRNCPIKFVVSRNSTPQAYGEKNSKMAEMTSGAKSLHMRSIRLIVAFSLVSVYTVSLEPVLVTESATVGTQSRSITVIFAIPLSRSRMPKRMTRAKRTCRAKGDEGEKDKKPGICASAGLAGMRRPNQRQQQSTTLVRLYLMLNCRDLRREGCASSVEPTVPARRRVKRVVIRPRSEL